MKRDEGESGKKQRPPSYSQQQQGRSPRQQQQQSQQPAQLPPPQQQQPPQLGSSAAQQIAGYIIPPQQQQQQIQQQMQYEQQQQLQQMQYAPIGYLPPQPGQMYDQMYHPGLPPVGGPLYAAAASSVGGGVGSGSIMSLASSLPPGQQMIPGYSPGMSSAQLAASQSQQPMQHESYIQPRLGRLPADRPIIKLSVGLIETYKQINLVRKI